jgi:hypothetical protein
MDIGDLKARAVKATIGQIIKDPSLSPEISRIMEDLLNANLDTFTHQRTDTSGAVLKLMEISGQADVMTVVDASGTRRYLVFV